jgi:hypothetical protein
VCGGIEDIDNIELPIKLVGFTKWIGQVRGCLKYIRAKLFPICFREIVIN